MALQSFVRVAEIWTPDAKAKCLRLQSGSYGPLSEFRAASETMTFAPGAGLPGRVWETRQPVVLNHFRDGSGFLRREAAARAGLSAGMGFPVHRGSELVGVCVLLCGHPNDVGGALEVWEPERDGTQLGLASGYYGDFDGFRRLSALVKFPMGVGLPGMTWRTRLPLVLDDLTDSGSFIRAAAAATYGLTTGLGVPLFFGSELTHVLVLLSARGTPIARVFEVWVPDTENQRLVLKTSAYLGADAMREAVVGLSYRRGQGLPGRVWETLTPWVLGDLKPTELVRADAARRSELSMGVGIPIIEHGRLSAVVMLLN